MATPTPFVTDFPLLGYRIRKGGLGYILEWWDGAEWMWTMDSIHYADCVNHMWRDTKYAMIDRFEGSGE